MPMMLSQMGHVGLGKLPLSKPIFWHFGKKGENKREKAPNTHAKSQSTRMKTTPMIFSTVCWLICHACLGQVPDSGALCGEVGQPW